MTPIYDLLRKAARKIEDLTVQSTTTAEKSLVRRAWRDFEKAARTTST